MNYFDTSALIKAFLTEQGTDRTKHLLLRDELAATATITYAEMYSGFSRKHREGGLSTKQYTSVSEEFESYWPTCLQLHLTSEVLLLARDLIKRNPLRGFDAVHLASALRLEKEIAEPITFIASDERLLQAADSEGLTFINVETRK
ncbi:MAG: twitching motility protein PilT [Nitrospirales bacterium]|nr:MAG: twitching motility protein PilT [Nitrospirales bacterium]